MSDHDGHTINVGPVTVGEPLAKADPHLVLLPHVPCGPRAARHIPPAGWLGGVAWDSGIARLCDEVDRLRDLLAKALPWIDPNDSHEDYLLTVQIREALGEPT